MRSTTSTSWSASHPTDGEIVLEKPICDICDTEVRDFVGLRLGRRFRCDLAATVTCRRAHCESIDPDRSRNVTFRRITRKPAPMLVPDTLTVKMTVKIGPTTWNHCQINSLDASLTIEWERYCQAIAAHSCPRGGSPGPARCLCRALT